MLQSPLFMSAFNSAVFYYLEHCLQSNHLMPVKIHVDITFLPMKQLQ